MVRVSVEGKVLITIHTYANKTVASDSDFTLLKPNSQTQLSNPTLKPNSQTQLPLYSRYSRYSQYSLEAAFGSYLGRFDEHVNELVRNVNMVRDMFLKKHLSWIESSRSLSTAETRRVETIYHRLDKLTGNTGMVLKSEWVALDKKRNLLHKIESTASGHVLLEACAA